MLWKFGLGSNARSKFHWCLAPRFAVQGIKTTKFADFLGGHWRGLVDPMGPQKYLYELNSHLQYHMKVSTPNNSPNRRYIAKVANLATLS